MKKSRITVTEAARNFSDFVNRVRYQNVSFELVKNGKPVARLVPETEEKVLLGRDAAKIIAALKLPQEEAKAWRRDLKRARKLLKPPIDKWR